MIYWEQKNRWDWCRSDWLVRPSCRKQERHLWSRASTASHGRPTHSGRGLTVSQDGPTDTESVSKKRKMTEQSGFDPTSLIESKEGTFKTPPWMKEYLECNLMHCLSKEEREALFKQHSRPDLPCCAPPKVDKIYVQVSREETRREKILESTDHSWSKYASGLDSQDSLFGEEFQTTLVKRIQLSPRLPL